jgi:hypothetical protein
MRLMCDTYEAAGVYWQISRPSAAEKNSRCIIGCTTAGGRSVGNSDA